MKNDHASGILSKYCLVCINLRKLRYEVTHVFFSFNAFHLPNLKQILLS